MTGRPDGDVTLIVIEAGPLTWLELATRISRLVPNEGEFVENVPR